MQNIVRIQRLSNIAYRKKLLILARLLHVVIRLIYSADLHPGARISPSVKFAHKGLSVVIGHEAIIEENVKILNNVTIGGRGNHVSEDGRHNPVIGRDTLIGANSCILGGIKIGKNVVIGAGSIVLEDVPDNAKVYGVKASIYRL